MYLNTTDETKIKREWQELMASNVIDIPIKVKKLSSNIIIPAKDGDETIIASFKRMTCGDYWYVEKISTEEIINDRFQVMEKEINFQEFRYQLIRNMMCGISLFKVKLNKNGILTNESFQKIIKLPAPLIAAFVDKYYEMIHISEEEEKIIEHQAAVLFAKNSRGVENACEAVSLFCTLGNFWEKFGLDRFALKKLPYKEYVRLRLMVASENQIHTAQINAEKNRGKISTGGKAGNSRGKVIRDTGQSL